MLHDVVQRKKFYTLVLQKCLTRSQKYDLDHEKIDEAKKEIELMVTDFYYAYMEMRNEK